MNFQHKYELVEAEIARVTGQTLIAMNAYDASIQSAKNHEFTQDEALANELAAKFYLGINKPKIAAAYLNDAYLGYISWGSQPLAENLLTRYPDLLKQHTRGSTASTTSSTTAAWLDLSTVVKASQAIASELRIKNLLNRLIAIVIENAAAQRGFLIAEKAGEFTIVAAGTIDEEAREQGALSKGDSKYGDSTPPQREPLRSGGLRPMFRSAPQQFLKGSFPPPRKPPSPCLLVEQNQIISPSNQTQLPLAILNYVVRTSRKYCPQSCNSRRNFY